MGSLGEGRDPERPGRDQALTTVDADGPANGQIAPPPGAPMSFADIFEKVSPAVVSINVTSRVDPSLLRRIPGLEGLCDNNTIIEPMTAEDLLSGWAS